MKRKKQICIICEREFKEYGNNALPLIAGRCCDRCNLRLVIPLRIKLSKALRI